MKHFKHLIILFMMCCTSVAAGQSSPRILMVVSSYGVDQGETRPGYEFDEFSKAYLTFSLNGAQVDVASPTGGKVEADKFDPKKGFNAKVLNDPHAMAKLQNTLPLSQIDASKYQAVFVVGGKGAMFDFHNDKNLQSLIASIYENQGTVSAVCHGPAALVNVQLSDGSMLLKGKRVNSFTNKEETAFGKKWVKHFEFLLEDKLKERGGKFEQAPMMLEHVAVDGRLITGQNPSSTTATAEAVLVSLGITPQEQEKDKESLTIELIARLLNHDTSAKEAYMSSPGTYQTQLIAMYGYYALQHTNNNAEINHAIELMELAGNHMKHPKLQFAVAQGLTKLGNVDKAKNTLTALLEENPDMQDAKTLLAELQ